MKKQRELAQSLAKLTVKGKAEVARINNAPGSIDEKNCDEAGSFFVGSRVHEADEEHSFMFQHGIESMNDIIPSSRTKVECSFSIPSCSIDRASLPNPSSFPNHGKEIKTNSNWNTKGHDESLNFKNNHPQDDHTSYLINLKEEEFKDMPAMMFYNLVRLWHVQQAMSDTENKNN